MTVYRHRMQEREIFEMSTTKKFAEAEAFKAEGTVRADRRVIIPLLALSFQHLLINLAN